MKPGQPTWSTYSLIELLCRYPHLHYIDGKWAPLIDRYISEELKEYYNREIGNLSKFLIRSALGKSWPVE